MPWTAKTVGRLGTLNTSDRKGTWEGEIFRGGLRYPSHRSLHFALGLKLEETGYESGAKRFWYPG